MSETVIRVQQGERPSDAIKGYCFAVCAVLIWSGFILVSRAGGLSALNAYDIIAIRYGTASLLLLPFVARLGIRWSDYRLWVSSCIGALCYALLTFNGFQSVAASHAAILLPGLIPVFVGLSAWGLLNERLNNKRQTYAKRLSLLLLTSSAFVLLFATDSSTVSSTTGMLCIAGGALCWAVYSVLVKRWQITAWQAVGSLALMTSLIYLPLYFLFLPKAVSQASIEQLLTQAFYQGFMATILQMWLYVRAIQLIGAQTMGSMMALVPLLAGSAALVVFNEPFTWSLGLAFVLVCVGLAVHQRSLRINGN